MFEAFQALQHQLAHVGERKRVLAFDAASGEESKDSGSRGLKAVDGRKNVGGDVF